MNLLPITTNIDKIRNSPRWVWAVLIAGLIFLAAYFAWLYFRPDPAPVNRYTTAKPTAVVANIPPVTVAMHSRTIQALPKAITAKKLKITPDEIGNDSSQIIQAVDIPATEGGAVAVTFLNVSTGRSRTIWKEKPRPFVSFESATEIGMRYGLSSHGEQTAALYLRRDLARIGGVHLSGYVEAATGLSVAARPEAKAMIDISYRWK